MEDKKDKNVWTAERVARIREIMDLANMASINNPVGDPISDYGDATLEDFIPDDSPSPEDIATQEESKSQLLNIINICLKPREAKVIRMRYGFEGRAMTLEEIGSVFKVTRERIRQVEAKALIKMRRYMKTHELYERTDWNVV